MILEKEKITTEEAAKVGITKESIIEHVREDMMHVGIAKSLWVNTLELPEVKFDKMLAKASADADHVAKGDEEGLGIVLEHMAHQSAKELKEAIEEGAFDADDNDED